VMIDYTGDAVTATVLSAGNPPTPTTTMLSADPTSLVTNQPVTLTATVTPGSATPDGSVEFFDHNGGIAGCDAVPVTVSGGSYTATCATSFSAGLPPSLSATFTPDAGSTLAGSTSPTLAPAVGRAPTKTTVVVSPASVGLGEATAYSATVTSSQPGGEEPTGSVVFSVDGQPLGQGAAGSPSCTGAPLAGGQTSATASCRQIFTGGTGTRSVAITATYGGDANFMASTSPPQTVTVVGPPPPPAKTSPPGKIGLAVFGRVSATATVADVVVACKGAKGQRCTVTLKLSSRERTNGGRLVSATAAKAKIPARTVTVGTRTITLAGGLGETVHVKLNAAGLRALSRLHELPVTLRATQETSRGVSRPSLRRFKFKAPVSRG
jgi:hypothetical protein